MRLSKKQSEIITRVKEIQKETGNIIYFMYNDFSNKIHAVKVNLNSDNEIGVIENKGMLCTHNVCMTMEKNNIIVPEVIGKYKKYSGEDTLYNFTLCKINPILL